MSEEDEERRGLSFKAKLVLLLLVLLIVYVGAFFAWRAHVVANAATITRFDFAKDLVGSHKIMVWNTRGSWAERHLSPVFLPAVWLEETITKNTYTFESDITPEMPEFEVIERMFTE